MSLRAAIVVAVVFWPRVGACAEHWLKLSSSHFDLYTTAGERKGREALLYFEQVRDFFSRTRSIDNPVPNTRVRIIAFQSEKEFAPYRMNEFAVAYYLQGYGDDYIVMQSIRAENYPVAVHEYMHLLIEHSGFRVPVWLNEGLAELYSTLKPFGKKMAIGHMIPGQYQYLHQHSWLPIDTLLTVDRRSQYYNERDRANIFYAESWALVHMVVFSPEYRDQSEKLFSALGSGAKGKDAFWQVYAKTTAQVQKDLAEYLSGTKFNGMVYDVKPEKSAEHPEVGPSPPLESGVALADVLALTHHRDRAKHAYYELAQDFPKSWQPEAGLAELAWREKDLDSARTHFARAVELGASNPRIYYDYARAAEGAPAKIPLLEKAVALDPGFQEGHRYLAFCLIQDHRYQDALDQLKLLKNVKSEQAYSYYYEVAYASLQLDRFADAQQAAEGARKFARNAQEAAKADELLHSVAMRRGRRESPVQQPD